MQANSENKQQTIVDDLIRIDLDLQKINGSATQSQIRQLIDCRRQLLADLKSLQRFSDSSNNLLGHSNYKPSASSIQLVQQWQVGWSSSVITSWRNHYTGQTPWCSALKQRPPDNPPSESARATACPAAPRKREMQKIGPDDPALQSRQKSSL